MSTYTMTKSPRTVAREALRLTEGMLPAYSSHFFRQDFMQPQLFALLALKTFFKTDYPGVVQLLEAFAELRADLVWENVPQSSTLCYAARRLKKRGILSCCPPRHPGAPRGAA